MSIQGSNLAGSGKVPYTDKMVGGAGNQPGFQPSESKAVTPTEKKASKADMERQIESLNKFMMSSTTHLKFTLHEKLNEYYVQIVSDTDNTVVREIPSKKMMDMVAQMHEMIGLLVDEKR
ncbi:flagellar protein FlaG [Brevibacillus centrosporus]|uniref:flagellar protein FlaG n=1 Tax=Brevibacillus centrosporus TaxID=54910 RepID=UPI00380AE391